MKKILRFFDKLEDRVRMRLSHRSILYALLGGAGVVLFWRAVWHTADKLMYLGMDIYEKTGSVWGKVLSYFFYEPITLICTVSLLLLTGLFVSVMIGDRIILSGLKHEKKIHEKTEEDEQIKLLNQKIEKLSLDIEEIKNLLKK